MSFYIKTKDFAVTGEEFELVHDARLDMLITIPQPADLTKYYESDAYISHTDSRSTFTEWMYAIIKSISLRRKVHRISLYAGENRTLLDVGTGTGEFLVCAKKKGWMARGMEPNTKARNKAGKKGLFVYDTMPDPEDGTYEVITLWHVLEHLPDLEKQIAHLSSLLAPGGTLLIAVPNFKSYDAKHYGHFWAGYDVPRHLWHFSRKTISALFNKQGMAVIKTHPMIFDAFYVSLLSEKYRSGSIPFIKAFYNGLQSNIKAWRSREYSSHIYVLQRAENQFKPI